jgi:hypothetical protein
MWTLFLAATLPWAEYGLVGLCMAALFGMLWRIIKLVGKRDENLIDRQYVDEARKELLEEIEKREVRQLENSIKSEERIGELLTHSLKIVGKNTSTLEKLIMRLEDLESHFEDIGE